MRDVRPVREVSRRRNRDHSSLITSGRAAPVTGSSKMRVRPRFNFPGYRCATGRAKVGMSGMRHDGALEESGQVFESQARRDVIDTLFALVRIECHSLPQLRQRWAWL